MKFLTRTLSLVTVASLVLFFANCGGGGGGGSAKEKTQLKKLSGTWEIATSGGADLDGDDRTSDFTGFTLTISGTYDSDSPEGPYSFSVTGSRPDPSPWPASGTWTFANISGNEGNLLRDDDVPMHYKITSNGQLTLEVECAACDYPGSGARTFEVNGPWTFVLDPQ